MNVPGDEDRIDSDSGDDQFEPGAREITLVEGDELAWLMSLGEDLWEFVSTYSPSPNCADLHACDIAFQRWQSSDSDLYSAEAVVEIVGGYLGKRLVADLDMEWVTVTDDFGTDYAVRSRHVEVMSFPFAAVVKRIEDREHTFVEAIYDKVKEMLADGSYMARDPKK